MKALRYITISVLMIAAAVSCSRDEAGYLRARGEGLLTLDFGYDPGVTVMTKADETEEPVFKVTVRDIDKDVIVKTIEDHRNLASEPLALREGNYEVKATNGVETEAAFDSPFYSGADTVNIVSGQTAAASIVCTLANVKVTVSFSDAVTANFSKYAVTVSNENPEGSLLYEGETIGKEGFFNCTGTLVWTISLTNTDGKEYVVSNAINDVKPRQYYNIHFDVDGDGISGQGGTSIRITVDNSLNEQEHLVDINLNKDPQPSVTESTGADISTELRAPQGVELLGLFNVAVPGGVERVTVSHNSSEIAALGVPNSLNLLDADASTKAAVNEKGLTWSEFAKGDESLSVDFRKMFANVLPLGTYCFTINVLDRQSQYVSVPVNVKVIPNTEVSIVKVDAWARFAYVYAQYNTEEEPAGMGFQYKKTSGQTWTDYSGELTRSGNSYSAKITGLEPETSYDFRAVTSAEQKDENVLTSVTEGMPQLPNFSFDTWYKDGKHWYANADLGDNFFWDSGNKGANMLSEVNPTSPEETFVISGKAAKLETKSVLGIMAGGNLYSGSFGETVGTSGAKVNFGRPYTGRPTTLRGYYAYTPKAIDKTKSPYESLAGQNDIGKIFVALADWDAPFVVNNAVDPMILFDPDDPSIIAYGELEDNVGTGGEYREFTIDIEYRDSRKPTYVVVVAVASKYADYFTGAIGSVMYIDEFEFGFE